VIIVGFLAKIPMKAVAVAFIMAWQDGAVKDLAGAAAGDRSAAAAARMARLAAFRGELHGCFSRRADALSELTDAILCADGPVRSPAELSVEPEFRRGHGSVYDALAGGRIDAGRLRRLQVAAMPEPAAGDPLMFGIDVTPLPRPDAVFADEMVMVQVRGAGGDRYLPGWPLSVLAGVHWGSSSWVDAIEARRLRPGEDHAGATVAQITGLLAGLAATGKWKPGDPPPLVLLDAGYPATDVSHALAGQPVQVLVRLRSDRVFYTDPAPRAAGRRGAPGRHGRRFALAEPGTRHAPGIELAGESPRYGKVAVRAWRGLHQVLERSGRWAGYPKDQQLPIVKGTVIQVTVEQLPDGRKPVKDLWLWHRGPAEAGAGLVDLLWKAYLRRFGQEHFHRFCKVHLGLDAARLTSAEAIDRWAALVLAAYTQLRLASGLVDDLRRPWHKKPEPGQVLSPCRVRLGFRRLRALLGTPARTAKTTRPGPGRPKGSKNRPKTRPSIYRTSDNKRITGRRAVKQDP
jgi:hypothetical protein